jgi:hypothetical protein
VFGPYPAAPDSYLNKYTISGPWNKGPKSPAESTTLLWVPLSPIIPMLGYYTIAVCWGTWVLSLSELIFCIPSNYYTFQICNVFKVKGCCGIKVVGKQTNCYRLWCKDSEIPTISFWSIVSAISVITMSQYWNIFLINQFQTRNDITFSKTLFLITSK